MLNIKHLRPEIHPNQLQEILQSVRQVSLRQRLDQITEIVRAVEGDPTHLIVADEPRRHQQLAEPGRVGALLPVHLEIDPLLPEQRHRVRVLHVARRVEIPKIELPDVRALGAEVGEVALAVRQREPDLDHVHPVDVRLEEAVVALRRRQRSAAAAPAGGAGADHGAGELGVHGDDREPVDDGPDQRELGLEVGVEDGPDRDRLRSRGAHRARSKENTLGGAAAR
ncbi:hypothetical protein EUGRSUZ_A02610 [Eucalyptus grandis]|uniref:Uncharacterized protein n=2 Tax=Eucalyptus grandis TaxID=71139 RepID=A0ACC3M6Q0_EUCGR|nr:hypothetical protein EUGRSUZ_A02610 [Eucalyptus grandis]